MFLYLHAVDLSISTTYDPYRNSWINNRLKSHRRFFNSSYSPCNPTQNVTTKQKQRYNQISQILTQLRQETTVLDRTDQFHGQGIVLTIDAAEIIQCQINLQMIEYTETHLPVQLWYSSLDLSDQIINRLLRNVPKLQLSICSFTTAQCRTRTQIWTLNSTDIYPPSKIRDTSTRHLASKSAAILSATFTEVLFLNIDSYLVRDPEYLFYSDPMYLQFGALFFPDIPTSRQPSDIWQLLNISCTRNEREFDSGILLVDKSRVWKALSMTKKMNDHSGLLKQLFFDGYRDTFRLAFRLLDVPYYMVGIPCSTGYYNGSHFCGLTICHTDSMGQYVFTNHLNLKKYVNAGYLPSYLRYTRIGLDDPYDQLFSMEYCSSCLLIEIFDRLNPCRNQVINQSEIDNYNYALNEPIETQKFETKKILMSETNNLMSGFVGSLFHYQRQIVDDDR